MQHGIQQKKAKFRIKTHSDNTPRNRNTMKIKVSTCQAIKISGYLIMKYYLLFRIFNKRQLMVGFIVTAVYMASFPEIFVE